MKVIIADKIGIAKEIRNKTVDIFKHPKFKNLYQFKFGKDYWMCSEYSIERTIE